MIIFLISFFKMHRLIFINCFWMLRLLYLFTVENNMVKIPEYFHYGLIMTYWVHFWKYLFDQASLYFFGVNFFDLVDWLSVDINIWTFNWKILLFSLISIFGLIWFLRLRMDVLLDKFFETLNQICDAEA